MSAALLPVVALHTCFHGNGCEADRGKGRAYGWGITRRYTTRWEDSVRHEVELGLRYMVVPRSLPAGSWLRPSTWSSSPNTWTLWLTDKSTSTESQIRLLLCLHAFRQVSRPRVCIVHGCGKRFRGGTAGLRQTRGRALCTWRLGCLASRVCSQSLAFLG